MVLMVLHLTLFIIWEFIWFDGFTFFII